MDAALKFLSSYLTCRHFFSTMWLKFSSFVDFACQAGVLSPILKQMYMLESVNVSFTAVVISVFKSAGTFCAFVYYCYLFSSVKTDTPLFVVMQNHLFSWIIKPSPVRAGRAWWQWNLFDVVACFYKQIMFMLQFFGFIPLILLQECVFIWASSL